MTESSSLATRGEHTKTNNNDQTRAPLGETQWDHPSIRQKPNPIDSRRKANATAIVWHAETKSLALTHTHTHYRYNDQQKSILSLIGQNH